MRFELTWQPLDESWLSATYIAALDGKLVGPETHGLAKRLGRRKLFKSISDCYKRTALDVLRDTPGFDPALYVWGRPYFILQPDAEATIDAMVELETLRDADSVMQLFYRQIAKPFRAKRDELDSMVRAVWSEDMGVVGDNVVAELQAIVRRVATACTAAEGLNQKANTLHPVKRRGHPPPVRQNYEPQVIDGLWPRGNHAAQLIAASELLSYNAVVWMWKMAPCWMHDGVEQTVSRLATAYPALDRLTGPPSDLFEGLHDRFAHVNAAMAQQLENNYSVGRYVPVENMGRFIEWWWAQRDKLEAVMPPNQYQKVLEAALYARVKNWSLIEASDVLMPFSERLP